MSINFQESEDRLKDERDKLKKEKDCKAVIFLLKDFETIMAIARKIRTGHSRLQNFSINEKLCMKFMTHRRFIGDGINGLLNSKNIHGHSRVSMTSKDLCKRLASDHDVFRFFNIKGTTSNVLNFAQSSKAALKTVQQFVRYNPQVQERTGFTERQKEKSRTKSREKRKRNSMIRWKKSLVRVSITRGNSKFPEIGGT